jgi:hypothetical protein
MAVTKSEGSNVSVTSVSDFFPRSGEIDESIGPSIIPTDGEVALMQVLLVAEAAAATSELPFIELIERLGAKGPDRFHHSPYVVDIGDFVTRKRLASAMPKLRCARSLQV